MNLTAKSLRSHCEPHCEDSITAGPPLELIKATGSTPPLLHTNQTGLSHIRIPFPPQASVQIELEAEPSAPPTAATQEGSQATSDSILVRDDLTTDLNSSEPNKSESTTSSGRPRKPTRYRVERIKLYNTIFMQDNDSFSYFYAHKQGSRKAHCLICLLQSAQTALCNLPIIGRVRKVDVQLQLIKAYPYLTLKILLSLSI